MAMRTNQKQPPCSLLDDLREKVGVEFLSDLHKLPPSKEDRLANALKKIPPEAASAWEWRDAYQYLIGHPPKTTGNERVRRELLDALAAD